MTPLDMLRAIRDSALSAHEKLVLIALVLRADNNTGERRIALDKLGLDTSLSRSSVERAMASLSRQGLVEVEPQYLDGVQIANRYRLNLEALKSREIGGH